MAKDAKFVESSFFGYMKLLFVVGIVSCTVFFLVFNNVKSYRLDKRIKKVKRMIIRESNNHRNVIIRNELNLTRKKIKKIARKKLGMVKTRRGDYLILR